MVKLDNWQTKAEKAAERRIASKQKKQQRDRNRLNKSLGQQLLSFLDEHNDQILISTSVASPSSSSSSLEIHIWTDMMPSSFDSTIFDGDQDNNEDDFLEESSTPSCKTKKGGRARSGSLNCYPNSPDSNKSKHKNQKGRPRSNSDFTGSLSSLPPPPSTTYNSKRKNKQKEFSRRRSSSISEENTTSSASTVAHQVPPLCSNHFFGCCILTPNLNYWTGDVNTTNNRRNISSGILGCSFGWHPSKDHNQNPTLADILISSNTKSTSNKTTTSAKMRLECTNHDKQQILESSLSAAVDALDLPSLTHYNNDDFRSLSTTINDIAAFPILYHQSVLVHTTKTDENSTQGKGIVDTLTSTLSQNNCSVGSIAYAVIGNLLIFDRYQDGIVVSDTDKDLLLFGGSKRRSISIGEEINYPTSSSGPMNPTTNPVSTTVATSTNTSTGDGNPYTDVESPTEIHRRLLLHLPGQVLEYILTFLPEQATAMLPMVCKSWCNEIGRTSPDLWRHLLDRHEWPRHSESFSSSSEEERQHLTSTVVVATSMYRTTFISHYKAVRDVKAVVHGLQILENDGKTSTTGSIRRDFAQLQFKDTCGGRKNNTEGKTFVKMWSENRVLVANCQHSTLQLYDVVESYCGTGYRCKQEVRVSVSPFQSTKKRPCTMTAMDIDNRTIGCLFGWLNDNEHQTWLTIIQREDLLCAAGTGGTTNAAGQLEEDTWSAHNLGEQVLEYVLNCDNSEVTNFLCSHGYHSVGFDVSSIYVSIQSNLVACGNGEFLFEAGIIMPLSMDEDMEEVELWKSFLFSSDFGSITWLGPDACLERMTISSTSEPEHILVSANSTADATETKCNPTAVIISIPSPDTIMKLNVHGPGNVEHASSSLMPPEMDKRLQGSSYWKRNQKFVLTSTSIIRSEEWVKGNNPSSYKIKTVLLVFPLCENGRTDDRARQLILNGNCDRYPLEPIRNDHILAFCENYKEDTSGKLFALLIHIPTCKIVYESFVGETANSQVISPHNFSLAAQGGVIAVSVDYVGMFVGGHGVGPNRVETTQERKGLEDKNRIEKKKKKGAKQKAKKDGFARGMRQTMG